MTAGSDNAFSSEPYPGLRPFNRGESDIFFGREEQTTELLRRLRENRFLAVVGSSGCGKSSLVRAGLVASLATGIIAEAGPRWEIAEMRPGTDPLRALADALRNALEPERSNESNSIPFLLTTLLRGSLGLVEVLRERPLKERTNLLIFVDQFEEIFRFRGDDKLAVSPENVGADSLARFDASEAFVALLLEVVPHVPNVYVLLTMRTDYLGNCAVFPSLPEALNKSQYLVPQLTREQRRSAIVGPAQVFESELSPELVARLLNDSNEPKNLPLLQHVLMRLWTKKRGPRQPNEAPSLAPRLKLVLADYTPDGSIARSLSIHAGEVYNSLQGEERKGQKLLAEIVFRALTERATDKRDRRRPLRWRELLAVAGDFGSEADVVAAVDAFRDPDCSFLMPPKSEALTDDTLIDISHESLINHWDMLQKWVVVEAEAADRFRRLRTAAEEHQNEGGQLLQSLLLENARRWQTHDLRRTEMWAQRYGGKLELVTAYIDLSATTEESTRRKADEERIRAIAQKGTHRAMRWAIALLSGCVVIAILIAVITTRNIMSKVEEAKKAAAVAQVQATVAGNSAAEAQQKKVDAENQMAEAEKRAADAVKLAEAARASAKNSEDKADKAKLELAAFAHELTAAKAANDNSRKESDKKIEAANEAVRVADNARKAAESQVEMAQAALNALHDETTKAEEEANAAKVALADFKRVFVKGGDLPQTSPAVLAASKNKDLLESILAKAVMVVKITQGFYIVGDPEFEDKASAAAKAIAIQGLRVEGRRVGIFDLTFSRDASNAILFTTRYVYVYVEDKRYIQMPLAKFASARARSLGQTRTSIMDLNDNELYQIVFAASDVTASQFTSFVYEFVRLSQLEIIP